MLKSSLLHVAIAVFMQFIGVVTTGSWWIGAAFAAGFFIGREHAQRQYKIAAGRSIKTLAPLDGFDVIYWGKDALLDAFLPLAVVIGIGLAQA